jgi:deoxyribose-phosphate aldolase
MVNSSTEMQPVSSISSFIEHTNLKPDASKEDIVKLCEEAVEHAFAAVCVSPYHVQIARKTIKKAPVKVVTVIGFPFGYSATSSKVEETKKAIMSGADELDMVINISALKSGDKAGVLNDIQAVVTACHLQNKICKVIIETAYLSDAELEQLCRFCIDADADYVKTSTGYAPEGATVEAVAKMRKLLPPKIKIKAAGGIRDAHFAQQLIDAGANRIGTSSAINFSTIEA